MNLSGSAPPPKERRQIPDQKVRDAADRFDDARLILHAEPPQSGLFLPLMNAAAVSLELYLKSLGALEIHTPHVNAPGLAMVTAKSARSHTLVDLLATIPEDVRQSLGRAYAAAYPGNGLEDVLQTYEGLFATSRYPFEKESDIVKYSPGPLMQLCSFLRTFVGTMKPVVRKDGSGLTRSSKPAGIAKTRHAPGPESS